MEPNNLPVIAKRFWNVVRAALFMLRQGITKKKLMLDLNLKMKRGKISAGKSAVIHNLLFHHHHHHHSSGKSADIASDTNSNNNLPAQFADPENAYEFSCENSPAHHHVPHAPNSHLGYLNIIKKVNKRLRLSASSHAPPPPPPTDEEIVAAAEEIVLQSVQASPAFWMTPPTVRQLRETDSPFQSGGDAECSHVDEDAEDFISRFYEELRRQNFE